MCTKYLQLFTKKSKFNVLGCFYIDKGKVLNFYRERSGIKRSTKAK